MVILVTGASGMLGTDLAEVARQQGHDVHTTDIRAVENPVDITSVRQVAALIQTTRPDVVVHCAAYTDVEGAERCPVDAYRANALGSWVLATQAERVGAAVCYISTDFVFDGTKGAPYHEFDAPSPINVYGASKLAGERAVARHCRRHWIARTAWLYGRNGRSFVRTMVEKAAAQQPLRVVANQVGSPTYTRDLAAAILNLIAAAPYGTYHAVNLGSASWYDLALAAISFGGYDASLVHPVSASEWPSTVRRPAYSVLETLTGPAAGLPPMRPWQDALKHFLMESAAASRGGNGS